MVVKHAVHGVCYIVMNELYFGRVVAAEWSDIRRQNVLHAWFLL